MGENFATIVVCDTEYEVKPSELPKVLCLVAHVLNEKLQRVRTVHLWRGEFGASPPFDIGPDTLFVPWASMLPIRFGTAMIMAPTPAIDF